MVKKLQSEEPRPLDTRIAPSRFVPESRVHGASPLNRSVHPRSRFTFHTFLHPLHTSSTFHVAAHAPASSGRKKGLAPPVAEKRNRMEPCPGWRSLHGCMNSPTGLIDGVPRQVIPNARAGPANRQPDRARLGSRLPGLSTAGLCSRPTSACLAQAGHLGRSQSADSVPHASALQRPGWPRPIGRMPCTQRWSAQRTHTSDCPRLVAGCSQAGRVQVCGVAEVSAGRTQPGTKPSPTTNGGTAIRSVPGVPDRGPKVHVLALAGPLRPARWRELRSVFV